MDINFSLTKGPSISLTKGKATAVSFAASKGITATVSPVATISVTTIADVNITNAQGDDILQYNSSSGFWENVPFTPDSNNVVQTVKNVSGGELVKGTPVHAITEANPSGQLAYVIAARADTASSMPATFVLNKTLANEEEGEAIVVGLIKSLDTSSFTAGDIIYVGETGGYTNVKPTGTNLIQNIGVVIKSHASNGSAMVYGSGRSNDVPNLPDGKFFIGSSTNTTESAYTLPTADGESGQALTTDGSGALSFTDIDADTTLQSAITISNNDAAFSHMTTPITAGTSLEAVLRDMLEKYNVTSISLTNISRAKQNTDGTYPSFSNRTSSETLEVGQGLRVNGFDYNIVDNTQTADTSVSFFDGNTQIETGFADDNAAKTLTTVLEEDPSSPTSASFKVKAADTGGDSDVTIASGTIAVNWKYRIRVGASSTDTISSNTDAGNLWSGMTLAYDQLRSEQDFTVTASAAMDTAGNYTWIAYPASFGNLSKILLDGSTDVLSDFESPVDYNITNDYSVTTSYRFYRSTFDQAFSSSSPTQVLTIEF